MFKGIGLPPVIAFISLSLGGTALAQSDEESVGSVREFRDRLESDGFAVREGEAARLDLVGNACRGESSTALYANQDAPYLTFRPPRTEQDLPTRLPAEFRMRPDEAVVVIGRTPPEARYFSYQPYLVNRQDPEDPGGQMMVFNSVGDTVNINTINTTDEDTFNRQVVLIFTPDRNSEQRVRAALEEAGFPPEIMHTLVIPSSVLRLGLEAESDTVLLAHRTALFEDEAAGREYIENPPLRVFRVTPEDISEPDPFPTPTLRVRGTGETEMDLVPELAELRQAILDANAGMNATEYESRVIAFEGFDLTQRDANSLGDTRDALYIAAGFLPDFEVADELTLDEDEYLIAYGPNHVATGKATYANINVYASETLQLPLGTVFSDAYADSAMALAGYAGPAADQLYAYKIARQCGGEPFCLEIALPDNCPVAELDSSTQLGVAFRNYLEPETDVGPAVGELLYSRIIKFSP